MRARPARQLSVAEAVARYAAGWFPMDDAPEAPEVPWYAANERAILDLDEPARAALKRKVRRDVKACKDYRWRVDSAYADVLDLCATPPDPDDGIWISERLKVLYRRLNAAGFAHSFELWTPDGELAAGILGVGVGRAMMLESMRRRLPRAGNALLVRTLDTLAARGIALCDIQLPTPHTLRLGARLIPREDYDARLAAALGPPPAAG